MKNPVAIYLFGTLSLLGLCLILMPTAFTPVYIAWQKIAHFLGIVVTTLILTVAYYLVITPSALIKRLFGGLEVLRAGHAGGNDSGAPGCRTNSLT